MKTKLLFFGIALSVIILKSNLSFPQYDDPNKDQIPYEFLDAINPQSVDLVVTDATGFDNFNIGTDFGEPHLVMNPINPLNTFVAYNTNSAHYSIDGYNWSATFSPTFGVSTNGDPITAFDSLGNLFYENMVGGVTGTRVIKSINGGQIFSAAVAGNAGIDKNWMAADQTSGPFANYLYTVMTNSGTLSNVRRSVNNGATAFTIGDTLTNTYPGMMVCVGPNGAISGGAVYIVTNTGASAFAVTYNFYRSTSGGTNFALRSSQNFAGYVGTMVGGRHSVQNMRTRPYPMIAADNSYGTFRGRLYVVYSTNNPVGNGNKPDIFCRYSDNQGATWSAAILVNDNVNPTLTHQFFPAIWCDKSTGRLYCKWFDTRLVPTNDSMDVYASYSDNGGVTWAANQRITTQKAKIDCATCGGGGTPRYQGDYDAINSNSQTSVMAWTDMRAGTFGSYTAYFPDFAMLASPAVNTIHQTNDSKNYTVSVPAVKLYTDVTTFSATVSPAPATGSIETEFLGGNTLDSYPNSKFMKVKTVGTVTPLGNYTITITGQGSNGTPVHKRTVTVTVGNILSAVPCENFLGAKFPPANMFEEFTGTNRWSRSNVSAYGIDSGSAMFNFFSAAAGVTQSLITNNFAATAADAYLTFDEAYAAYIDSTYGPDTLLIETSSNLGNSYSVLTTLVGKHDGTGELNTGVPPTVSSYVPASGGEWQPRIFSLPAGTNKIRLKAISGFGNNLYMDNICIINGVADVSSIGVVPEAMYIPAFPFITFNDTIKVFFARTDFPNVKVDSAVCTILDNANAPFTMNRALTGTYYIYVKHRNTIETWSRAGGEFYARSSFFFYNFINPSGQAYDNNQKQVSTSDRGMFSGDVNQDYSIDLADLAKMDNAVNVFASGYVVEDLNGDFFVDLADYTYADNNSFNFVTRHAPPGGAPLQIIANVENIRFESDAVSQKYEQGQKLMRVQKTDVNNVKSKTKISAELQKILDNRNENKLSNALREERKLNKQKINEAPNSSRIGRPN